jgi:hypothetical protein
MSYCFKRIPGMEICELNFRFLVTRFGTLEFTLNLVRSIIFILNNIITECMLVQINIKGKAIPLQAWTGPEGSRRLRLPDFKTVGT